MIAITLTIMLLIVLGLSYKGIGMNSVNNIYNSSDMVMSACKQLTSQLAVNNFTICLTTFVYIMINIFLFIEIPYGIYKMVKGVFVND